jgi:hypothetical protein
VCSAGDRGAVHNLLLYSSGHFIGCEVVARCKSERGARDRNWICPDFSFPPARLHACRDPDQSTYYEQRHSRSSTTLSTILPRRLSPRLRSIVLSASARGKTLSIVGRSSPQSTSFASSISC